MATKTSASGKLGLKYGTARVTLDRTSKYKQTNISVRKTGH